MSPQAREALARAILKDLRVSQTSASFTAARLHVPEDVVTDILRDLITNKLAESYTVADCITVYRITLHGLEIIA